LELCKMSLEWAQPYFPATLVDVFGIMHPK